MDQKISVLIVNYNNAKNINECIQSLINQTYKNIEIILFVNLFKDKSINEIKKFKNDHKVVKLDLFHNKDSFTLNNQ